MTPLSQINTMLDMASRSTSSQGLSFAVIISYCTSQTSIRGRQNAEHQIIYRIPYLEEIGAIEILQNRKLGSVMCISRS